MSIDDGAASARADVGGPSSLGGGLVVAWVVAWALAWVVAWVVAWALASVVVRAVARHRVVRRCASGVRRGEARAGAWAARGISPCRHEGSSPGPARAREPHRTQRSPQCSRRAPEQTMRRASAIDMSWWLWQGGAGNRLSANARLRTSSGSSSSVIVSGTDLRPETAE